MLELAECIIELAECILLKIVVYFLVMDSKERKIRYAKERYKYDPDLINEIESI